MADAAPAIGTAAKMVFLGNDITNAPTTAPIAPTNGEGYKHGIDAHSALHCSLFTVHCSLFTVHCSLFGEQ